MCTLKPGTRRRDFHGALCVGRSLENPGEFPKKRRWLRCEAPRFISGLWTNRQSISEEKAHFNHPARLVLVRA
jgi:hypothetical protein